MRMLARNKEVVGVVVVAVVVVAAAAVVVGIGPVRRTSAFRLYETSIFEKKTSVVPE